MADFKLIDAKGVEKGTVTGPDHLFGLEPNVAVMHQVVTAQLAARRQGTHKTKTRSEVAGGGRKPWRQKGTGRARAGSTRAPHWRGGGVALGPTPRDYSQRTPKKMIRLALASALSDRAADDKVRVIDDLGLETPKTKDAIAILEKIDVWGKILIVVPTHDGSEARSFRNLLGVQTITQDQLNTFDVLVNDFIVFTKGTFETACETRPSSKQREKTRLEEAKEQAAAFAAEQAQIPAADSEDKVENTDGSEEE